MPTILNVVIPAREYDATVSFYRDALGLPTRFEGEGCCFLDSGGVNIAIHPVRPDNEFAPTGRGLYLDVSVGHWQETKDRLQDMQAEIHREWEDATGRFLLAADPEGNLLELVEYR